MRRVFLVSIVFSFVSEDAAAWEDTREVERIRAHLAAAERAAREKDTTRLTAAQRARRTAALDALRIYREAGVFPRNKDFSSATPYFVDDAGTRCAMAQLIHSTGDDQLVEAVARTRNNAYVRELADERALLDWLEENGLTVEEAAAIQPAYCTVRSAALCWPAQHPVRAVAEASWVRDEERGQIYAIDRLVYGDLPADHGEEVVVAGTGAWPRLVLVFGETQVSSYGLRWSGEVQLDSDPECEGAARLEIEEAVLAWTSGADCADRAEVLDPRWATSTCYGNENRDCSPEEKKPLPFIPDDEEQQEDLAFSETTSARGCRASGGGAGWVALGSLILLLNRRRARR